MGCSERVDVGEKRWWSWNRNDREAVGRGMVEREWWQCGDMQDMQWWLIARFPVQARQVAVLGRYGVGLGGFGVEGG